VRPIDWFTIGTAIARANGIGVMRQAPNPHAAVLFWTSSSARTGQQILANRDFVPTNTKVVTPFSKQPVKFVDAGMMLDSGEKWEKLYEEIFHRQGRPQGLMSGSGIGASKAPMPDRSAPQLAKTP
jgi:iron(III) transport system substrate-binding protein